MKNLIYLVVVSFLGLSMNQSSTSTTLIGQVTDLNSGEGIIGASVLLSGTSIGTITDFDGNYKIDNLAPGTYDLEASYTGYKTTSITDVQIIEGQENTLDFQLSVGAQLLECVVVTASGIERDRKNVSFSSSRVEAAPSLSSPRKESRRATRKKAANNPSDFSSNNNEYGEQTENTFQHVANASHSTFGIDVDRASYSIVRNYIRNGSLPPADAVRAEELINYFSYNYYEPEGEEPFAVHSEWATCPWNPEHLLLSVALQGKCSDIQDLPPNNLIFLLDVSGSMSAENKLPLVKSSMSILLDQLKPDDKISIVVYASKTGLVLPPTKVANKSTILAALDQLQSGGSTAGGQGIELAYKIAREQFLEDGNNRVILATDGDFNIGVSNPDELESLIEKQKDHGVFLTVLGFGMGNLKDNRMERLADKGNGTYNYIDTKEEAEKVFEVELASSLYTIAKDVKLQLEFNPQEISEYRLIGYENRMLNKEDFDDDTKDAGELGAGHTVTALYEVIPTNSGFNQHPVNLELRYKRPQGRRSFLLKHEISQSIQPFEEASENLRWAASVASYSMLLTNSPYQGESDFFSIRDWAISAKGDDRFGYRQAFIEQLQATEELRIRFGVSN